MKCFYSILNKAPPVQIPAFQTVWFNFRFIYENEMAHILYTKNEANLMLKLTFPHTHSRAAHGPLLLFSLLFWRLCLHDKLLVWLLLTGRRLLGERRTCKEYYCLVSSVTFSFHAEKPVSCCVQRLWEKWKLHEMRDQTKGVWPTEGGILLWKLKLFPFDNYFVKSHLPGTTLNYFYFTWMILYLQLRSKIILLEHF